VVAKLYEEAEIEPSPEIAGILLSGVLADTLLFRGPTTTREDRRVGAELAQRAGVDMEELGNTILNLASDVSDRSAEQLLAADFKDFSVDGCHFGIGTIETTNGTTVLARREELLSALSRLRERGYTSVLFAVIDIMREQTSLLVVGHGEAVATAFEKPLTDEYTVELPGIVSRKKHIVPLLGTMARQITR
jgi:manganese-dependent inorganic pyrophosphatase